MNLKGLNIMCYVLGSALTVFFTQFEVAQHPFLPITFNFLLL